MKGLDSYDVVHPPDADVKPTEHLSCGEVKKLKGEFSTA